jgi:hypothetical protein
MADINYLSIFGETVNHLRDCKIYPTVSEGGDRNPIPFDDLLKYSNSGYCYATRCTIGGEHPSREDAIDINNGCSGIFIDGCFIYAGLKYAITIKGASNCIVVSNTVIVRPGKHVDIDIGNWSDQYFGRTCGVKLLNVVRADGEPVRVRVGRAEKPEIVGGNCRVMPLQSLGLKAYWHLKHAYVTKIKKRKELSSRG